MVVNSSSSAAQKTAPASGPDSEKKKRLEETDVDPGGDLTPSGSNTVGETTSTYKHMAQDVSSSKSVVCDKVASAKSTSRSA